MFPPARKRLRLDQPGEGAWRSPTSESAEVDSGKNSPIARDHRRASIQTFFSLRSSCEIFLRKLAERFSGERFRNRPSHCWIVPDGCQFAKVPEVTCWVSRFGGWSAVWCRRRGPP